MEQNSNISWLNSQLMKAHCCLSVAIDRANHFPLNDRQQLRTIIANIELIDIEILQLLSGDIDSEWLMDDYND